MSAPGERRGRTGDEPLEVRVAALESVRIGRFRAPREHPRFSDSGPARAWLIVFPRTSVWIQHAGRPRVLADPSRAMLYNQGQEYRRAPISDAGDRCDWFGYAPEVVAEAHARFDAAALDRLERPFTSTHARVDARTYALQRRVFLHAWGARDASTDARLDPLFVEEASLELLARVVASAHVDAPISACNRSVQAHTDLIEGVKQLATARLGEPMSLAQMARAVASSPFHVARVFRSREGGGIHAYRTQLRLRASLERVAEGADLTEVALDLGFSSHSHFTVAFARAFGETPSAFRASVSSKKMKAAKGGDRRR